MNEDGVQATVGPGPGGTGTTSVRSYKFFKAASIAATGNYASNAIVFADPDGTNFVSNVIQLYNDGAADIFYSFDGTNDHGQVKPADPKPATLPFRHEKGIWLRGTVGGAFRLAAW